MLILKRRRKQSYIEDEEKRAHVHPEVSMSEKHEFRIYMAARPFVRE